MQCSCEVRWFLPEVETSAEQAFAGIEPESRIDWYAFPCDPRCGVKVRQERYELKLLVQSGRETSIAGTTGNIEHWQKWSVAFDANDTPATARLKSTGWIAVEKQRRMRVFTIDGEAVREIRDRQQHWPRAGCQFEWTAVESNGQRYSTVSFEAFSDSHDDEEVRELILKTVMQHALPDLPDDALARFTSSNSYGYAQWLQRHVRQDGLPTNL